MDLTSSGSAGLGLGLNLATGNWIGAAIGAIGLGTSLFGGLSSASVSKQQAAVSEDVSQQEQNENAVRQQAMEMSAQRAQLQTVRTAQRARAMAIQAGASQGASYGSGVAGGVAETENEGYFGLQGINNQVSFGRQMFGYDSKISQDKQQLAQLGGQMATDQGIASVGGAIMKAGPMVGAMFGGFGKSASGPIGTFAGGGNDGAAPIWS